MDEVSCPTPHIKFRGVQPVARRLGEHAHAYFVNRETMLSFTKFIPETCITELQKKLPEKSHQLSMIA